MSATVNIGSSAEWNKVLGSSIVVIVDCMFARSPVGAMSICHQNSDMRSLY